MRLFLCFSSSSTWEPDPDHPFLPPEHLRDMIDSFELNEAPSIGLPSRPLEVPSTGLPPRPLEVGESGGTPTLEVAPGPPALKEFDEDMDFFVS